MSEIKVKDGDGVDKFFQTSGDGLTGDAFLSVPASTFLEIAKGNVPGHECVNKFGFNDDVDSAEDIWDAGGIYVPPTAARVHNVTSTNANDTSAGTGARTIRLQGLDTNYDPISETVTMNGTSNVVTVNSYVRIFRAFVETAGSNENNLGDITITAQTDNTLTAQITAEKGQTLMAIYTVPNGKTGYLYKYYVSIGRNSPSGANGDFELRFREGADNGPVKKVKHKISVSIDAGVALGFQQCPIKIVEKSDVWITCTRISDVNSQVSAGFLIVLVDD